MSDQTTMSATGTDFADIVYAEPEWLRAEFDALIAAQFGPPAVPPPPAPPDVPARRRPPRFRPLPQPPTRAPLAVMRTARDVHRRQRSPPSVNTYRSRKTI